MVVIPGSEEYIIPRVILMKSDGRETLELRCWVGKRWILRFQVEVLHL